MTRQSFDGLASVEDALRRERKRLVDDLRTMREDAELFRSLKSSGPTGRVRVDGVYEAPPQRPSEWSRVLRDVETEAPTERRARRGAVV